MCAIPAEQAKCWRGKPEETPTAKSEESSPGVEGWGGLLSGEMGAGSNKRKSLAFVLNPFLLLKTQSGGEAVADKRVDSVPVNREHVSLLRDASR